MNKFNNKSKLNKKETKQLNLDRPYVLKGNQNGSVFNIAFGKERQKLDFLKDELSTAHPDIYMWITENDEIDNLNENKQNINCTYKLEEVSRNELIGITKSERDLRSKPSREARPQGPFSDRFKKADGYKGFSIKNIDTTRVLFDNALSIQLQVGDYDVIVELDDILYWIQMCAENSNSQYKNQINTKVVTQALMNSIDGMNIKVDCSCADWKYRFAYQASVLGYKYGAKMGQPNEDARANPDNRGGVCKHIQSVLANKRWLQQVTGKFMDWLEKNIDDVNFYLGLKGDKKLTLPNELARQNAKLSWQTRKQDDEQQDEPQDNIEQPLNKINSVVGNNPSTNKINNVDNVDNDQEN